MEPEALLTHESFLRGLALSLVLPGEDPEDVVQDTFTRALEHPPRPGPGIRGWLATVARNALRNRRRGRLRRLAREASTARPDVVPSDREIRRREAVRQDVVDAVLRLDGIYRSVILLRYFEGLPPREVAARLEIPVETVRTRVRRGLDILRASLDESEGGRRAWTAALLPVAGLRLPEGSGTLAGLAGAAAAPLAAVAISAAIVVAVIASVTPGPPPRAEDPVAGLATDAAPIEFEETARDAGGSGLPKNPFDGFRHDFDEPTWNGTIEVTVLDAATEAPIAGALVRLDLSLPDEEDSPLFQEGRTGADGKAVIPTTNDSAALTVRHVGYGTLLTNDMNLDAPNFVTSPGDGPLTVRLTPMPPLAGRVTDRRTGEPVAGARVRAWLETNWWEELDRELTTGPDGAFTIAGAPPDATVVLGVARDGFVSVIEKVDPAARDAAAVVTLGEGAVVEGRVLDDGGRAIAEAEVFVSERGVDDPLRPVDGDRTAGLDLSSALVEALRNRTRTGADGRYAFRGMKAPGDYIVSARTPRGTEVRSPVVSIRSGGDRVTRDLTPVEAGSIALRTVAGDTGEVLGYMPSRVTLDAPWGYLPEHRKGSWDGERGCWSFPRVSIGKHRIWVKTTGYVARRIPVTIEPGSTIELEVALDRGEAVTGRLVRTDGTPVRGNIGFDYVAEDGVENYIQTMSEKDGTFVIQGIPPGVTGEFSAYPQGYAHQSRKGVRAGADVGDVTVHDAPLVIGRVVGVASHEKVTGGFWYPEGGGIAVWNVTKDDGTFEFERILADRIVHIYVGYPGRTPFVKRNVKLALGEVLDLGDVRLPEKGVTVRGAVLDATGKPVPFAVVRVEEYWYEETATADSAGRFELPLMPPGLSHLIVMVKGVPLAYQAVDAAPDGEPVTVTIKPQGTIVATVTDAEGEPVPSFPFQLFPLDDDGARDWNRRTNVFTDNRGVIRVQALEGRFELVPHPNEQRSLAESCPVITVTDGNVTEVRLQLD